jgi:RNA polymerase sigma-70 factor (ECF subfamily)
VDGQLVRQLRQGDVDAGWRFVHEQYPGVYRYLLYLTGRSEWAEDLTQETFLQAWRCLGTFDERASLKPWLHGIAHRRFLQALRARRTETALEGIAEPRDPRNRAMTEAIEWRAMLDKLPVGEREVVVLHYLEGYPYSEIAAITGSPVGRVTQRLFQARERLRRELGDGDLVYLNESSVPMRQWAWLPLDQIYLLATRLTSEGASQRVVLRPGAKTEDEMERREFLRQAAVGAAGMMLPESENEVVDGRLSQKVTLTFKTTALADLCDHLWKETGVHVTAGGSVADEKVTLFCQGLPLREVMRQLSRPFGYAWVRSTRNGQYRYELLQDLRSQLLEEELRNRDRRAALLALEKEIERYRPYLDLSPDEALARSKTASPNDKKPLETFAGFGWGPIQMYFRLSHSQLAALRAGQTLIFSQAAEPGEYPLPPELARGVLQSFRGFYVRWEGDLRLIGHGGDGTDPNNLALTAVPDLRARLNLTLRQSELGELTLHGESRIFFPKGADQGEPGPPYASGKSPAVLQPDNRAVNLRFAGDALLRPRVTVQPQPSCRAAPASEESERSDPDPKVTSADVLESLHRATTLPIVADYYTCLYRPGDVTVRNLPLFEALNQLADTMRLRWRKEAEGSWLQFRSVSFYDDRLKEVPNRLLSQWAAARRQRGSLSLDEVVEIAQLSDAQLDAREMAEGARECFGLAEWELARSPSLRPHLRYLATFTPEQRRRAASPEGLPFPRMSLAQQQQFLAFYKHDIPSLELLQGASLRVDYSQPGGFQWANPENPWTPTRWVVIVEPGLEGRWVPRPLLRGRTRQEVMEAVRRLDSTIRQRAEHAGGARPKQEPDPTPLEAQIFPTKLSLTFLYFPSASNALVPHIVYPNGSVWALLH